MLYGRYNRTSLPVPVAQWNGGTVVLTLLKKKVMTMFAVVDMLIQKH